MITDKRLKEVLEALDAVRSHPDIVRAGVLRTALVEERHVERTRIKRLVRRLGERAVLMPADAQMIVSEIDTRVDT
jgi:hypothetical protein